MNTTTLYRGKRNYELSNHLGNVQVVISDKRKSFCDEELGVERFEAEVLSGVDYYPFGMLMPGRQWYVGNDSSSYSFGFNGQEKDDEVKGIGNSIAYELRIYDSRLGKFLSGDPRAREYPWQSTYAYFSNSPIKIIDFRGGGAEETETESVPSNAKSESSQGPLPDNPVKALWWNFRLALTKTFTNMDCIKVNKKVDGSTGKKYSTTYCGKDSESEGNSSGGQGGAGGNPTTPGGGSSPPVPLPGTPITPPPLGSGTVVVNLNENAYPGATPGASTGAAINITQNFAIPAPPAGFTGGTGTLWISYGTDIALLGTPTGTDNVSNAFTIAPVVGTTPGAALLNTGQVLVGNVNAGPFTVTPGQQFTLIMNPDPTAVTAGTTTDRFFIVIRVTFP